MSRAARPQLDESGLRWALLLLGTLGVFAPLLLGPGGDDLNQAQRLGCLMLVLLPASLTGLLEPRQEGLGSALVQRLERLAPMTLALALGGALLFPTAWTWRYAWALFALHVPLPLLWHLPRARAASLGVLSLAGLVGAVLAPEGAWCLLALAALWLGLPALDRSEALRQRQGPGARLPWGPLLLGPLGALLLGVALFAGASALLPPSRPLPEWASIPAGAPRVRPAPGPGARPPLLELGLLVAGAVTLVVVFQLGAGLRRKGERGPLVAAGMQVGSPARLDPGEVARAVAQWPAGPRREVVETYLAHLQRLEEQGHARAGGTPPLGFASALGAARPAAAEPAARLAARFSDARWGPAPAPPEAPQAARAEAAAAERSLADPTDRATIQG